MDLRFGYAGLGEPVVEEKPPDDSDLDGIPDDYDECPKEAGPEDRNGCPAEQDLDGDEHMACIPGQETAAGGPGRDRGCPAAGGTWRAGRSVPGSARRCRGDGSRR